jgi:hypothetical protein
VHLFLSDDFCRAIPVRSFFRDHLEEAHQYPDSYHEETDTEKRIGDYRSGVEIENATSDYHREDAAHYG